MISRRPHLVNKMLHLESRIVTALLSAHVHTARISGQMFAASRVNMHFYLVADLQIDFMLMLSPRLVRAHSAAMMFRRERHEEDFVQ